MNIPNSFSGMTQRIADQFTSHVTHQLRKLDLDGLLGAIGLQVSRRPTSLLWPVVAAFGAGIAVGTLLAPMSGKELRAKLVTLVGKSQKPAASQPAIDGAPNESPYEQAARGRRDDAGNNGQKKVGVRAADGPLPT